ncbi:HAD hydrolase-like protein [Frigoribacterium sp. CFBP9039]|uniref:HAD hydrolase-like protein n=1 Tax=Frigoribacterium TaxID=96492 RepID=UPI0017821518|nr:MULTISPECIES: HAD hydrolase-like protein [Frigoribacterium]MBD8703840.1 HAD hydrolase-like protein [Frigoribacterium sp. CFBP 13712]MCJ0700596.1 HAD hydrolase-like protein [Frigoribacterium faeni]MDY0892407.1 HAD hydrolase-like protein [Frigoribacterium sp. CFBP9030]MDY0946309.1 HAD hydrolase-like protein [Frigoribacterium sp. CFBP9039]
MRHYDIALFDIDGTLCDPGSGITEAAAHALARMGVVEADPAALRRFVGPPLEHSFRDLYGFDAAAVTEAVGHYRDHYADGGIAQYRPYPGIGELLERLLAAGVQLGVVTAKIQEFAEGALQTTGLRSSFTTVHGRAPDDVVGKAVTLRRALQTRSASPGQVVMIGDREHDVEAALENGVDVIGVLYGFGTAEELRRAGARLTAAAPRDVGDLVLGGPIA